jgi:hypothetical protein
MANIPNPIATTHLPMFVAGPGETDVFLIIVVCILLLVVLLAGVFYFTLHSLPEKMAHGADRGKMQFVGILSLVAMFTHNNYFWIAALLIAAVRLPDLLTPIKSLSESVKELTVLARDNSKPGSEGARPEGDV